jgi:hypothetical protein
MCQSVASFYTCNCAAENYIQKCKLPSLKCVERLKAPEPVSLGVPCPKHASKLEGKATKIPKKERETSYPPTSFTKKISRRLSNSQLSRPFSNKGPVTPRTLTSTDTSGRRPSTSSSVYSDASVAPSPHSRSARSRAESYAALLDLGPLSLEQSASLAEAQETLRRSIKLDNHRRATEAAVFDIEIAPAVSRQPSQRIKQTILSVVERKPTLPSPAPILSPRTANTHPVLRDQLSPWKPPTQTRIDSILSPTTISRDTSIREKAARIRASLERERHLTTDLEKRPASAKAAMSSRSPLTKSPIKKREYTSWSARPSHTRVTQKADRLPQTPPSAYQPCSRISYEDFMEDDLAAIQKMSESERYELFLEKDRRGTAAERQRRAERKARGGFRQELRDKSDGICVVM